MTISTTGTQVIYTGDGVSLQFAFPYPFITTTDLLVYLNGVLQAAGYSVLGTVPVGGSGTFVNGFVTFSSPPAAGVTVLIYCDPDLLQSTALPPNDPFPAKTVEKALDKLTLLIQRIYSKFGNAIIFPAGDNASGLLPAVASRANKLIGFDASGNVLIVAPNSQDASAVSVQLGNLQVALAATVVWTSDYATLALALTAAAGRQLMVNSAVLVTADTTIASTISVQVVTPGLITVNSGKTLTINGSFEAGQYTVFAGAGAVVFGNGSRAKSPRIWFGVAGAVNDTQRTLLQTDGDTSGPLHSYEDNNTLNFTHTLAANFNAYAAFDANYIASGAGNYDHLVGFQARYTYSGSGSVWSRMDGFNWLITHNGAGPVNFARGLHAQDPLGAGAITFLAGAYIEEMTRGASSYGIFCQTPLNAVQVGAGKAASWLLQGNGQVGGFGLSVQSRTDSLAHILQTANQALLFGANNIYYGALSAAGLWKMSTVGVTDILSANQRLEVSGVGGATFKATGGAAVAAVLNWNNDTAGNNIFENFYTETAASLRGSIDFNRAGTLTRYNTTSDATLKNIIGDAPKDQSVQLLEATRLREYSWKEDASNKPQIGVIAQELYETFKGAVSVGGEYEDTVDGETLTRYRPWGVDKTAFTFHLIAGFQYQQEQIKALEARLAALEKRLAP